jgi:NAD(P)H-hydrate epimerase
MAWKLLKKGRHEMPIPAIKVEQMVEVDRLMIEEYGIHLIQMMENAGRSLAELARRLLDRELAGRRLTVLCGSGNNGGGGMVAARHLSNWGAEISLIQLAGSKALGGVIQQQMDILTRMGIHVVDQLDLADCDLIVDALLGYGLQGNPREPAAAWIRQMNQAPCRVLSLDIPSGLDATQGSARVPTVQADATMTLALPKTGLLATQAREYVGDLYLADIGVPPQLYRKLNLEVPIIFNKDTIVRLEGPGH